MQVEAQVEKQNFHQFNFEIHKEKEMVAFRKWFPVLAVLSLTIGSALTANAQVLCNANAGVPPIVRAEGYTEQTGDIVLDCTGGNSAAGTFLTNIQIFLNTNITSRLTSGKSEALLMIGEPGSLTGPAPNATAGSGQNVFQGTKVIGRENALIWTGIPITPPGSNHLIIRITNVRANAAALGVSSSPIPSQIVAFIAANPPTSIAINNPSQTVGYVQQGMFFDVRACNGADSIGSNATFFQCNAQNSTLFGGTTTSTNTEQFAVRFREGFPSAFKPRFGTVNGGITASNSPNGLTVVSGSSTITVPYAVSRPGDVYNSESAFTNTTLFGTTVGIADSGTRVAARFNNIPAGTRLFVTLRNQAITGNSAAATLVGTDANGSGSSGTGVIGGTEVQRLTSLTCGTLVSDAAEVTVVNGSAVAVWEVFSADPSTSDTLVFGVAVAYASNTQNNLPGLGTSTVIGSLAPFYVNPTGGASGPAVMQDISFPIPRFIDNQTNVSDFSINTCQTNLLFPFVTNQAGFDTGLAISNTSRDPFSSASSRVQGGTCTLNFYGTNATGGTPANPTVTSTNVDAGAQFLYVVSSGGNLGTSSLANAGFQGYIIAQCRFQYAHGFAFVTDGPIGQARVAEGYLALILDAPVGSRTGASSESLNN
ncbi:MAG TPA: hypothetical protein VMZ52_08575 [Bryobacteraceae bacterium]|nr:hypothetical protein [Bryobacteraceae bacterium]